MIKKTLSTFLAITLLFVSVTAPATYAQTSENTVVNVESYTIETLSDTQNEEGFYEPTGYKNVNSITEITDNGIEIETKLSVIEDYYDTNNTYKDSSVVYEEFNNNWNTGEATQLKQTETFLTPLVETKVVQLKLNSDPQDKIKFNQASLTAKEEANVRKKVESLTSNLSSNAPHTSAQGITKAQIAEIKKVALEVEEAMALASTTERAGAYDNFFNHTLDTGDFVVQSLSSGAAHKYLKYTGTTKNNTTQASSLVTYKGYINNYEKYVIQYMESALWPEVTGWIFALAGLITMVAGFAAGPAGWVAIVSNYIGALSTFAGLTTSAYATKSRMDLSKTAAQYQNNAMTMNTHGGTYWPNSSFTLVNGY
ncbi:hypothetical protein ACFTRD_24205 [Paenibacillus sp. NPDC056933]|uniref:hypothetical protein n=1 Tax=Paenibacillus sp. NPDC056933 TaxID=3345968 RepID=UPI00362689F8